MSGVPFLDEQDSTVAPHWLAIVGIGDDGVAGLSEVACGLIGTAEIVFGARPHLAPAASLIRGTAQPCPAPFDQAAAEVMSYRGQPVCLLAPGNPFQYGVCAALLRRLDPREITILPSASSFGLAAAKLAWPLPETVLLAVHGGTPNLVHLHAQPGARILALTSGGVEPRAIAKLLCETGFGTSRLTIMESLGGPHERVRTTTAAEFPFGTVDALSIVAIDVEATPGARLPIPAAALTDALLDHDGDIASRDIRALAMSALAPRRGQLLWDIGSGSGAIAIAWMLVDQTMRAIAVEQDAKRICRNAAALGVPWLGLVQSTAPDVLGGLPAPDAIFIGGAIGADVLDAATRALRPRGRLVVHAVTPKTETALLMRHGTLGGELTRIAVPRAGLHEGGSGMRPTRPMLHWVWTKP